MGTEFIEDYSFGEIIIDGERYSDDVILLGKKVKSGWWRDRGHKVSVNDLKTVIDFDPEILILGKGSSGRMKVPSDVTKKLNFKVESYQTRKACKRYNELMSKGEKTAGGFHLTC